MQRADKAPGQTSPLPPITVPLHKHGPWPVYSSLDTVAKHHPVLAEHTAMTHINTFIINTSPSPPSARSAHHTLKEIAQSNLKWPEGGVGKVFFFISMCQLAPLSIIVMLKDMALWGKRGRTDGTWHWRGR